jgi:hypothetical protein
VAGRAADRRLSCKELFVQVGDHLHHLAGRLLGLLVVARVIAHHVAVVALHAERGRDVLHDELPLIRRNVLQHLNIAQLKSTATAGSAARGPLGRLTSLRRCARLGRSRLLGCHARASGERNHQRRSQDAN